MASVASQSSARFNGLTDTTLNTLGGYAIFATDTSANTAGSSNNINVAEVPNTGAIKSRADFDGDGRTVYRWSSGTWFLLSSTEDSPPRSSA